MYGPMERNCSHALEVGEMVSSLYELDMIKISVKDFGIFSYIMSQMPSGVRIFPTGEDYVAEWLIIKFDLHICNMMIAGYVCTWFV
jgi:hypothetical protein